MAVNTNIGQAFPLEKLGSDIARNEFNYQSILTGLIEWNKTTADTVTIRLTKDTDPWYEDYIIPSKTALLDINSIECTLQPTTAISYKKYAVDCILDSTLYGGSKALTRTTFDGVVGVNPATDEVTVADASEFSVQDTVVFDTTGTIPTGLTTTEKFIIKSKSVNVLKFYEADGTTDVDITAVGSGTITMTKLERNPAIDETDPGDIVTFRLTVTNNGGADWELYYYQLIKTWTSGDDYKFGNLVIKSDIIYKLLSDIEDSTQQPSTDTGHFEPLIKTWTKAETYYYGDLVKYEDVLYRVTVTEITNATTFPPNDMTKYELYASKWTSGTQYDAGSYVLYNGKPYIATVAIANSTSDPETDTDSWELAVILPVPTMGIITENITGRWQLDVDTTNFIFKNSSSTTSGSTSTDIDLRISIKTKEPASIYQKNVEIFSTSNYASWPDDKTGLWSESNVITQTNEFKPITERQSYSAVMTFDHTRLDIAKTINYINYDGPDLDQGLCIYLPIEVPIGESAVANPEDGFTYEFFFRIWPNTAYTGAITRDHIINKAQIYVYSAPTLTDISNNNCGTPIAKFSMARLTNFYVFGENIAVPDKPVCYRATFIYSEVESKWITLDYYQLPDHVFLGPVGFIDPQSPANLDLNNDVIGNVNPNAANIGYETGSFPLFQDPFSNPDLTPYRISGDTDLDIFKNRIV